MSQLSQFLQQLSHRGEFDSEGVFTVDRSLARQKLERYRLEDSSYYILSLLGAAVESSATQFSVHVDGQTLKIRFDGTPFLLCELENINDALFNSEARHARLRELAVALHGARGLQLKDLEILSFRDGHGLFLYLDPNRASLRLEPCPETAPFPDHVVTEITLRFQHSLKSWFGPKPGQRELALLKRFGRFAPLALSFERKSLSVGKVRAWPFAGSVDPDTEELTYAKLIKKQLYTLPARGRWFGYLGFDSEPAGSLLVASGLRFPQEPFPEYPLGRAIIWVRGMEKDLSQRQLVKNKTYQALRESVLQAFDVLVQKMMEEETMSEKQRAIVQSCRLRYADRNGATSR